LHEKHPPVLNTHTHKHIVVSQSSSNTTNQTIVLCMVSGFIQRSDKALLSTISEVKDASVPG